MVIGKFNVITLSNKDTNPTVMGKVCLEYAKHIGEYKIKLDFNVIELIDAKMLSRDADGYKLSTEFDAGLNFEGKSDAEKEKFRLSLMDKFVQIPIEFAIQAIQAEANNQTHDAWVYALDAMYWTGILKGVEMFFPKHGSELSANGLKGAIARLLNDPKQHALKEIEDHYQVVKDRFKRRGYGAEFIRDMHAKYPVIVDVDTIKKLVTALKKSSKLIPVS